MKLSPITLDMADVYANATIQVRVRTSGPFRFRRWLGFQVMKMGARIVGCGFFLDETERRV